MVVELDLAHLADDLDQFGSAGRNVGCGGVVILRQLVLQLKQRSRGKPAQYLSWRQLD